ncbi:MAG: MarR family transcriptional regulator [Candidatus Korarchaeota archaeon]|nr:MarR family transcriptional regulator [Candidatus Korarchaeota archaeon]
MKQNATILAGILLLVMAQLSFHSIGGPVAGVTINEMNVSTELYENTSVKVTITAEIVVSEEYNSSVNSLMFPILPVGIVMENPYKGIENLRPLSGDISVSKIETKSYADVILVKFGKEMRPGDVRNITFSFMFKPNTILVRLKDNTYRLVYRFYMPNATVEYNRSTMRILLPYGAAITKIGTSGAVEMDPLSERLTAFWKPFPLPRGNAWDFSIVFRVEGETLPPKSEETMVITNTTPSNGGERGLPLTELLLAILGSNVITGGIAFMLYKRASRGPRVEGWSGSSPEEIVLDDETEEQYRELMERLDRDERSILDIILEKGGKIEQKDLPELTGFSKSKVSRILKRLDSAGVVRRTSVGKTKIVEINPVLIEMFRKYGEL